MAGRATGKFGEYSILIDRQWSLEDLYVYPRAYEQVYFAMEAIAPASDITDEQRIEHAFSAFPWRGGYSAVGFYNQLKWATPPSKRPKIKRLKYSSPGTIDLIVNLPQVLQVALAVNAVAGSIFTCNKVYHSIHKGLQDRKLLRTESRRKQLELEARELNFIVDSADTIAQILGYPNAATVTARAQDPLIGLKLLLSLYRRVRILAEYQKKGKAFLPLTDSDDRPIE